MNDIGKSRLFVSIERKPLRWRRWGFCPGITYVGTKWGLVVLTPFFVVILHCREGQS
jgi:hypothetical protein